MTHDELPNCFKCKTQLPKIYIEEQSFGCNCGINYIANFNKWLPGPTTFKYFRG